MRIFGGFGILVMVLLAGCAGFSSNQEAELVENGYTAMAGGDYYTAEHLLNQALVINDKNPYALLNLGVIYQETNRFEKAREFYQSVIDLNPKEKAVASNVQGYAGKNLSDIAMTNLQSLPPATVDGALDGGGDADKDGIPDEMDKCPNTPAKAVVSAIGCWTLMGVFPSGMTTIGPDAHQQLDQVANILQENPSLRIEIQGHTDNLGTEAGNQGLSAKRAQSVMLYLIDKGVDEARLQWVGYGQSQPMTSNETAEGRKQNRRVELTPIP